MRSYLGYIDCTKKKVSDLNNSWENKNCEKKGETWDFFFNISFGVDMHPLPPLRDRERKGGRKILNDIMDRVGGFLIKNAPYT